MMSLKHIFWQVLLECNILHCLVSQSEKNIINKVHSDIKFMLDGTPSKVRIQSEKQKEFVLLQATISRHSLDNYKLRQFLTRYMVI